jgi:hypothetical protein
MALQAKPAITLYPLTLDKRSGNRKKCRAALKGFVHEQ